MRSLCNRLGLFPFSFDGFLRGTIRKSIKKEKKKKTFINPAVAFVKFVSYLRDYCSHFGFVELKYTRMH